MKSKLIAVLAIMLMLSGAVSLYYRANREELCFFKHLSDAIGINNGRADYYASRSGGLSKAVSQELINNEKKLRTIALLIDIKAQRFINHGIPIVCGDFVSMHNINSQDTKAKYGNVASDVTFRLIKKDFFDEGVKMTAANRRGNFWEIAERSYTLLQRIMNYEISEQSSFCMSKHVVESIGLAALHAPTYVEQSSGSARAMAQQFLEIQLRGLADTTLSIDMNAQAVHKLGVGIVCNDVPPIPFAAEWEAQNR